MANDTMIKLGLLSKKSPSAVETIYNNLMDTMKKSNSIYKAYDNIPEKNVDAKSKKYGEFMAVFMVELKKKLGIDKTLEVEGCTPKKKKIEEDGEGGAVAGVTTGNMGGATMATGEKAPYGSSAVYADRMSMTSRGGQIGMPKPMKKKKKKIRESIQYIDNIIEAKFQSKRAGRPSKYWDEAPEGGWGAGKPICPLGFYLDEESKLYKIKRIMKSSYTESMYNAKDLNQDLLKTFTTEEEAIKARNELLEKYFSIYLIDKYEWIEKGSY